MFTGSCSRVEGSGKSCSHAGMLGELSTRRIWWFLAIYGSERSKWPTFPLANAQIAALPLYSLTMHQRAPKDSQSAGHTWLWIMSAEFHRATGYAPGADEGWICERKHGLKITEGRHRIYGWRVDLLSSLCMLIASSILREREGMSVPHPAQRGQGMFMHNARKGKHFAWLITSIPATDFSKVAKRQKNTGSIDPGTWDIVKHRFSCVWAHFRNSIKAGKI